MQMHTTEKNLNVLRNECKEEYLRHHPEMREVKLSDNKMLYEVMKHYLKFSKHAGVLDGR